MLLSSSPLLIYGKLNSSSFSSITLGDKVTKPAFRKKKIIVASFTACQLLATKLSAWRIEILELTSIAVEDGLRMVSSMYARVISTSSLRYRVFKFFLISWSICWISEVVLGGKNSSWMFFSVLTWGCAVQLSTSKRIFRFTLVRYESQAAIHSVKIWEVIQAFLVPRCVTGWLSTLQFLNQRVLRLLPMTRSLHLSVPVRFEQQRTVILSIAFLEPFHDNSKVSHQEWLGNTAQFHQHYRPH